LKKYGFSIEDIPLEPLITLKKQIGDEYYIELIARAIERDEEEDEEMRDKFVQELDDLSHEFDVKSPTGYLLRNNEFLF